MDEIKAKTDNEILNVSAEAYAQYLSEQNQMEPPTLHEQDLTLSSYEADIPANRFPPEFSIIDRNGSIKRPVAVFHVPFDPGDRHFFNLYPPNRLTDSTSNEILFEYIDFYKDAKKIKILFDNDLPALRQVFANLRHQYAQFNSGLKAFALREINAKREKLLQHANYLASFNIPLKTKANASKTFAIPSPALREKIIVKKPEFSNQPFVPEPTLDYSFYQKILKLIDDTGRNFERMPSTYKGKDEETLRDHILLVLDPNFQMGSATGETFNKKGKTDILLRYDSSVVFIAECKFWKGMQAFHETLDQLLGYLTWRDSKSSVVLFVRNKEFIPVIDIIKRDISNHSSYLRTNYPKAENWLEYGFSLPNDPSREILLSVLAFHVPFKTEPNP